MINVMNNHMNQDEKSLDSQLWHACAGGMVQMPQLNSRVFYFPQGHAEHSNPKHVNFRDFPRIPPFILCQVSAIEFKADIDTDEVYAKITLTPLRNLDLDEDLGFESDHNKSQKAQNQENSASFAKTLTQSDANNGGGFSVPRYCAETIFPRLDYSADPPVQTILAKDVHGQVWKFRHIYRGTPRRHLLTTGWSNFVNHKKLVAGDSIVFLRASNGDLCVGIRRAKRGLCGGGGVGDGVDSIVNHYKFERNGNGNEKVSCESVIRAANLAANGRVFEVLYYPRASTPEFCVKAATVKAAMRVQWCPGMRFKMAFETEDSSRISWFMGTVSSVGVEDRIRWPNSPWRLLEVAWDEPDLLQNVKRVSPWLVELVSNTPTVHLSPFLPPRKKLRVPIAPDFSLLTQLLPTSIQGARQNPQLGSSSHHLHFNKIQSFPIGFSNLDEKSDKVSCLLTIGTGYPNPKKKDTKKPIFVLFGQPILTEQQLSEEVGANLSDGSVVLQNGSGESSLDESGAGLWFKGKSEVNVGC